MAFISLIVILLLTFTYLRLENLLNPGFASVYDLYLFRKPFTNYNWIVEYLERQNVRDGLFKELTTEVQGNSSPIKFTFAPFWVDMDRWLMAILLVAVILLIINRILVLMKILPKHIADIPVYVMIILSIAVYYLSVKILGGYVPQKSDFHLYIIGLIILSVFAIVFGIFQKRAADRFNNDPEKENKTRKMLISSTIVITIQVLLFIILPGGFMTDAIRISNDYKPNYGSFDPYKVKVRYDLEKNGFAGNFANQAVDTDEGLYFIENEYDLDNYDVDEDVDCFIKEKTKRNASYIRKLDAKGNITDICEAESDDSRHYYNYINIGYADGYLYASTWYSVFRIDPKDGSAISVISAPNDFFIAEMCVVDNKLYYAMHPEDPRSEVMSTAWVCEIAGDDISEPELYAGGLDRGVITRFIQFESSTLLTNIVSGDFIKNFNDMGGRFQRCDGKSFYISGGREWNDSLVPTSLVIIDDEDPENPVFIEKVGGFNIFNDNLYYVQLKEDGLDLCKSDLNGLNAEVIDTYTCDKDLTYNKGQSVYRIMIGQGKIYVSANGYIFPRDDSAGSRDLEKGEVHFVTDLK